MRAELGSYERAVRDGLRRLGRERFVARVWAKDGTVWTREPQARRAIEQRLGWLTAPEVMIGRLDEIARCVRSVRQAGFTHVVLLGMGGSSLCADVCRRTLGVKPGYPELIILDTTDPATIARVERSLPLRTTLFIVASKSGTTIEVDALSRYFSGQVRSAVGGTAGDHFIAITDPGTPLETQAREERYRHLFLNPADVGGRYSALSYFGLVPAALIGVNLRAYLHRARAMARRCRATAPERNPGVRLGAILGALAAAGRDKVTMAPTASFQRFGMWAEQLLAESTGKEGRGLIPVDGESPAGPEQYGDDRLFIRMARRADGAKADERWLDTLQRAGHPVVRLMLKYPLDLAGELFRWEFATAAAGALLRINPFDEPNVAESKEQTRVILASGGTSPVAHRPTAEEGGLTLFAPSGRRSEGSLTDALWSFLGEGGARDYVAILAYLPETERHDGLLQTIRRAVGGRLRLATTLGYGPRYLHSTGQLHKGGAGNGRFLLLTADDREDLQIPGRAYTFGALKRAQALGDYAALARRGCRLRRLHLGADVTTALERLAMLMSGSPSFSTGA